MAKSAYIEKLAQAIEQEHKCHAKWVATGPVKAVSQGKTIWEGDVETFALIGHPKAKRAFGWRDGSENQAKHFVTVLELPPVNSAEAAVKAVITENAKKIRRT